MSFENLSGQFLGQYELRDSLGQGGMGAVYRAVQANLKRDVAIKILPTSLALQSGYLERFTREAEIAAALQHPHIVPIIDYGMQRGISYVVMRLLTGGSLAQRINQRMSDGQPLPSLSEAAHMLTQLASALDYAHSQGVIHRDIKTSNIMFDDQGNAYVVDFGIAKLQGASQNLTSTGMALGTSAYMPPEQWRSEPLTPAADQYAMAVTMYILLTGRVPYDSDTPGGLMYKHFNEMPTPPQQYRTDLPDGVSDVLNHALAKKPEDRYADMAAFAQAFQQAISGHEGKSNGFFTFKVRGTPRPAPVTPINPPSGPSTVSITPPVDPTPSDHIPTVVQPTPLPIPPLKPTVQGENTNSRMYWALGGIVVVFLGAVALFFMNRQPSVALLPTSTVTETSTTAPVPPPTYTSTTSAIALVATATPTIQPSHTLTVTSTSIPLPSPTATLTPSLTSTATSTVTESPTATATFTRTPSATSTSTATDKPSPTKTATANVSPTPEQPKIISFSVDFNYVLAENFITLTWSSEADAAYIELLNEKKVVIRTYYVVPSGSQIVKVPGNLGEQVYYQLVVIRNGQRANSTIPVTVQVNATPTATPAVIGVIASSSVVNVREGPSVGTSAIGTLKPGTSVQVLATDPDGKWFNILMDDGREGWVAATFVRLNPVPTEFPTATPSLDLTALAQGTPLPTALVEAHNLLVNDGLEEGSFGPYTGRRGGTFPIYLPNGWNYWFAAPTSDRTNMGDRTSIQPHPSPDPSPHGGSRALSISCGYFTCTTVIFQTIGGIQPSANVQATAWSQIKACNLSGEASCGSSPTSGSETRIGIDPTGGSDPNDPAIVWSAWVTPHDLWLSQSVSATVTSTNVTVFLYSTQPNITDLNKTYWDDVSLTDVGAGSIASNLTPAVPLTATPPSYVAFTVPQGEQPDGSIIHTIQNGDTMDSIAYAYGTTRTELLKLNNLQSANFIFPGQKLIVRLPTKAAEATESATPSVPFVGVTFTPSAGGVGSEGNSDSQSGVDVLAYCDNKVFGRPAPNNLTAGATIDVFWSWYANDSAFIQQHLDNVIYDVKIDGKALDNWREFATSVRKGNDGNYYIFWYIPAGPLAAGQHTIMYNASWKAQITDGYDVYGPGTNKPSDSGSCTFKVQ